MCKRRLQVSEEFERQRALFPPSMASGGRPTYYFSPMSGFLLRLLLDVSEWPVIAMCNFGGLRSEHVPPPSQGSGSARLSLPALQGPGCMRHSEFCRHEVQQVKESGVGRLLPLRSAPKEAMQQHAESGKLIQRQAGRGILSGRVAP